MSLESPRLVENAAEPTQVVQNQEEQYRIEKAKSRILKNGSIGSSSYQEIALGFSLGAVKNPRGGHYGERMSIDGNQLFSYRTLIAVRAEREDGYFFLLDGARYSKTSDTHQGHARHYCRDR